MSTMTLPITSGQNRKDRQSGHPRNHGHNHEGEHFHRLGECCGGHEHSGRALRWRLLLVLIGGICLLLSGILRWLRPSQMDLAVAWSMAGAIITALPIFRDALLGFRSKTFANTEFYMNQFITLAVIACFVTQQYVTGAVVAIILLVGHILEDRSMLGTNEAINSLLHLSRVSARRLHNGVEEEVEAEHLAEGETIRVRPGDTIPADGTVLSGFSTVNQASITGESLPVEVTAGADVFAGTSNLTGLIEVEVTNAGTHTVLGRVKDIVEEAQQTRAPIVRLTEEYARYYMPLILLIAGFVLFFTKDVQRAISVIVVSIPCTFVLAGPSAMVAALAAASRMGILVKSVRFFEAANDVDTVVFDKTGTLTTGELKVAAIKPRNEIKENELLAITAAVEQHSTHPIARAVVIAAQARGLEISDAVDVQEKHGHGLLAQVGGQQVVVGRGAWLQEQRIIASNDSESFGDLSALHVGVNRKLAGIIYLSDTVRAEATNVTENLREQGVDQVMMLTGDRHTVAEAIAGAIGLTDFRADCLPEQKQEAVQQLKADGRNVMVVGDGVNDAPALAAGNLSVAMGALGSDVAIQTADIALMGNDLNRVSHFLGLSDKTLRIINQNMLCGLAFVGAAIVLAGAGLIPPIAAAFIHEFGAFFVIFNSARLLRFEGKEATAQAEPTTVPV
ncbi:MAG: cation-translocating P-type ATPase [Chthoniobacterales bacterium]